MEEATIYIKLFTHGIAFLSGFCFGFVILVVIGIAFIKKSKGDLLKTFTNK